MNILLSLVLFALLGSCSGENGTSIVDPIDNEEYEETKNFENVVRIVVPSLFALIVVVGVIGNLLVIIVVLKNRQMQNSTNVLIVNLAISDLLFLTLCVPFTAVDWALAEWVFSSFWCPIQRYLESASAYATVWTLTLLAIDRFLAVVLPVRSMAFRSIKSALIAITSLWILVFLANIPALFRNSIYTYSYANETRSQCMSVREQMQTATTLEVQSHYFTLNLIGYVLPLGIISALYAFILRRLWFGMPNFQKSRGRLDESVRMKKTVTQVVTGVIVVFAICWLPLNICFFLRGVKYPHGMERPNGMFRTMRLIVFQLIALILAYANSCLNPILYSFMSRHFRSGFRSSFQCSVMESVDGKASMEPRRSIQFARRRSRVSRNSEMKTDSVSYYPSRQPSTCVAP